MARIFNDFEGISHEFEFTTRDYSEGLSIRGFEIQAGERRGYEFAVLGVEPEEELLERLYGKIERALAQRHLEYRAEADTWVPIDSTLRGYISFDRTADEPLIIIDGKELTWEQFGKTMLVQEGFQFRLSFVDITEDI
jgi:hypothetical protein